MNAIFAIIVVIILISAGNNALMNNMYNKPSDIYKVRSESVDLCNEISRITSGEPSLVYIYLPAEDYGDNHYGNFVNGGSIYGGITQYNNSNMWGIKYYTTDEWESYYISDEFPENYSSNNEYITHELNRIHRAGFQYLVIPNNESFENKIQSLGYTLISRINGFCIYNLNNPPYQVFIQQQ